MPEKEYGEFVDTVGSRIELRVWTKFDDNLYIYCISDDALDRCPVLNPEQAQKLVEMLTKYIKDSKVVELTPEQCRRFEK